LSRIEKRTTEQMLENMFIGLLFAPSATFLENLGDEE